MTQSEIIDMIQEHGGDLQIAIMHRGRAGWEECAGECGVERWMACDGLKRARVGDGEWEVFNA